MPIRLKITHLDRLVFGASHGTVTLKDIGEFIDAVVKAKARPYRKLFDATDGTSGLSDADVKALAKRLNQPGNNKGLGPFAIVSGSNHSELVRILRPFASIDRPMRVFRNIQNARKWLYDQRMVL